MIHLPVRPARRMCFVLASVVLALLTVGVGQPVGAQWHPEPSPLQVARGGGRALVLSGGAGVGTRGWELGLLQGLRDAGLDLLTADVMVGTSTGAFLGAQLGAGRDLTVLYESALTTPPAPPAEAGPLPFDPDYFEETRALWTEASADTAALRMEIGQRALTADRVIPEEVQIRMTEGALGGIQEWPNQPLRIATTDVLDGSVRFFEQTDGVPLAVALAASTAQPGRVAPITIADHRYMDGGVAGTNIDGALGADLIIAITPGPGPKTERELAAVRAQGSRVLVIAPDAESQEARGTDPFDTTRLRPSAEAGYRQAATVVAELRALWEGTAGGTTPSRGASV